MLLETKMRFRTVCAMIEHKILGAHMDATGGQSVILEIYEMFTKAFGEACIMTSQH